MRDVFDHHTVCRDQFNTLGRLGFHQNERQLGCQLAAQSAQVQLDLGSVRHDDAEGVAHVRRGKQGAGREFALFSFHHAVQSDAATMLVALQGGLQVKHLLQGRARIDRAAVLRLHRVDHRPELTVLKDDQVDALLHQRLDLLHHFVAIVAHAYVDGDRLAVIVQLFVQGNLELQFTRAQHKVLAHHGAGLTTLFRRRVLDLADPHHHRAPLMGQVGLRFAAVHLHVVTDAAGLAGFVGSRLKSHAGRCALREREVERYRVRA